MRGRIKGVAVNVRRPIADGVDELGNPVSTWSEPDDVANVLVAVGATADTLEENRPDGITVAYTLVFPSTYTESLRGCEIQVPNDESWYSVIGDPLPQIDGQALIPYNGRNRVVQIARDDG